MYIAAQISKHVQRCIHCLHGHHTADADGVKHDRGTVNAHWDLHSKLPYSGLHNTFLIKHNILHFIFFVKIYKKSKLLLYYFYNLKLKNINMINVTYIISYQYR